MFWNGKPLAWRHELGIAQGRCVLLFAGKFEPKKKPLELMHAVRMLPSQAVLIMVGSGELETQVRSIALGDPERFRILPFQKIKVACPWSTGWPICLYYHQPLARRGALQ